MTFFKKNAGSRVAAISLSLTLIILLVYGFQDYSTRKASLVNDFESQSEYLLKSSALSLSLPLFEFDVDIVDGISDSLFNYREVTGVKVIESNGTTILEKGELRSPITKEAPINSPDGKTIGTIEIHLTDAFLKADVRNHTTSLIVRSALLAFILAGVVTWSILSLIKPIKKLDAAVQDYDFRKTDLTMPGADRIDEFGSLARSFQTLSGQLRDLLNSLEQKVDERTAELKEATKAARDASVAKSQFLANMSHEIRTPMNGVLGMTEVLRETSLDDRQVEYVDTIYKSGNALITIINDILDFSKIEAGRLEIDPAPFDLRNAVEDVAQLLSNAASEKSVELSVRYHPKTPVNVIGDVGRIRQILTNLVGNAVKFTHEGYVLIDVMGTQTPEGDAALTINVQDTGIGISEEKLGLIFDEFTQAEGSTTRRFGGTGLGLTISKRLVEAMDGEITASSEIGVGSSFEIRLTLPLGEATIAPASDQTFDLTNRRILIVDDLEINRRILLEQLSSWGMKPYAVASGAAALDAMRKAHHAGEVIDAVILDFQMPDMDGAQTAAKMQSDPEIDETRLIILSSVDEAASMRSFIDYGVDACLSKPAKASLLKKTIGELLLTKTIETPAAEPETTPEDAAQTASAQSPSGTSGQTAGQSVGHPSSPASSSSPLADDDVELAYEDDGKLRILVAEDNDVNRVVIRSMIESDDRILRFAEDGKKAYNLFKREPFDLIFMDVSMPVMDGEEATKAIRAYEEQKGMARTRIICLTAHAMKSDRERFLQLGMDAYLAKPVKKADIEEAIHLAEETKKGNVAVLMQGGAA